MRRRAADTSSSGACQVTPPRGVEMPVSRFAISENFSGRLLTRELRRDRRRMRAS
jgi:hypothetical protein